MLWEVMGWPGPLTHRQFLAWLEWETMDMSVPGKTEYYQMQIACETRRVLSSQPNSIRLESFKLNFTVPAAVEDNSDLTRLSKHLMSSVAARMGGAKIRVIPRDQVKWVYPTDPKLDPRVASSPESSNAG